MAVQNIFWQGGGDHLLAVHLFQIITSNAVKCYTLKMEFKACYISSHFK